MEQPLAATLPTLVVHADWGSQPGRRWMVRAALQSDGRYYVRAPEPVGRLTTLVQDVLVDGCGGAVVLGFDFPIGLPIRYAEQVGITHFMAALPALGQADWSDFYHVAEHPAEIGPRRPFYPQRSGNTRQAHLVQALGVESIDDLRRRCDRKHQERRAAAPIFWTLGGQQVGKAAISGWRDVLAPAVRSGIDLAVWPFDGRFFELLRPGRVVVAETYPAECYHHLGVSFSSSQAGRRSGKRVQHDRRANAPQLLAWAEAAQVVLDAPMRAAIDDGFGVATGGDDGFDAAIGCFGILNIVLGRRAPGDPRDQQVRALEGWILGQLSG